MSNYWRKKLEELNAENEKKSSNSSNSSQNYWQSKLDELEETNRKQSVSVEDIAPVTETKEKRKWINTSALDDGFQWSDIPKIIVGTTTDTAENLASGIMGMGEKALDGLMALGAKMNGAQMMKNAENEMIANYITGKEDSQVIQRNLNYQKQVEKDTAEFIAKDLYNEEEIAKTIITNPVNKITGVDAEQYSIFGERSDSLIQSGGQLAATIGLQAVGVPWFVTTGATSFGGEVENALNEDATLDEAIGSGLISAGAEILSEKLTGGISFGGKTFDDLWLKPLTEKISSKALRTMVNLGVDAIGEGGEEFFSSAISNIGSALYKEESIGELLTSEEAMDEYLESAIGGFLLGGGASGFKAAYSYKKTGRDYATGLTANEQKVVDVESENRIKEAEENGKTLTGKEKNAIKEQVKNDLKNGYISTDTIESVLGGDTYKSYQDTIANEDSILKEFEELGKTQNPTLEQSARYAELQAQVKEIKENSKRSQLQEKLSKEVQNQLTRKVGKNTHTDDYLLESYNEKARRGEKFTADVSKYSGKVKEAVRKAIDSGILNNTRRTHEFVDMVAKISADKGVSFNFTNNAKLKESGFAVDGSTVNGFVNKDGVTLNIQSAKHLNTVVGHEITHVLEGTELYDVLKQTITEYAKTKGDYQGRYDALTALYKNIKDADVDNELVADLVGDYLFTDADFVNHLSAQNRNVFQKIYDEIKYLCKVATAGSKEARELEKVKRAFEKAYKASAKTEAKSDTQYSLSDSDGKKLTKEQSEYFKDSKMRDENGNLKVMYHGSQDAGFHTFDASMSDDDTSFFFVDRNDVAASYSGTTETYEAQTIHTAEDMNNFIESIGAEGYEVVEKDGKFTLLYEGDRVADSNTAQGIYDEFCWYEGVGEGDANYKVYLNLKNPLEIDAKGRPWNKIDAEFSQEVYDKYKSLTEEERAALIDLAEWEDFRMFNSEIQEASGNELASAYAKMGEDCNIYDLFSVAADNFSEEAMRENARNYLKTRDYAQRAKEQGYDGVIFKKIHDNGGYSNGSEGASTVAIAFESNQIKSVANENPTGDPDIRYSLSADSNGNKLSPAVAKRFENSKAVDENGDLLILYHGTYSGEFSIFDKAKGSVEGDFGSGFYFTNDENDVSSNYEGGGPDFDNKVARRAEQIEMEEEIDYDEAEEKARKELYKGSHKFEVYLNIENPAIVGETDLLTNESYLEQYNEDDYDSYDDYIADVEELVANDIENIVWEVERSTDVSNTDGLANVLYDAYYEGGISIADLKSRINDLWLEDSNGNMIGNEVTRQVIESLGYDGIIDNTVSTKFKNMGLTPSTTHYIVFKPNQIKAVTNQNPTDNPDIHKSLSPIGETPKRYGNYHVSGKDIALESAPTSETIPKTEIAPVENVPKTEQDVPKKESVVENNAPVMTDEEMRELMGEPSLDDLRKELDAAVAKFGEGDFATQEEADRAVAELSELSERIRQYEAEEDAMNEETLASLDGMEAPPETDAPYYGEPETDTTPISEKAVTDISDSVRSILGFNEAQTAEMQDLIQRYAQNPTETDLHKEIAEKFGEVEELVWQDESLSDIKRLVRSYRFGQSDMIKAEMAYKNDGKYGNFRKKYFGKILMTKDGSSIDTIYNELSELYPEQFPSDIYNAADQLERIVEVVDSKSEEYASYKIDAETIESATDTIVRGINEHRMSEMERLAESYNKSAMDDLLSPEAYAMAKNKWDKVGYLEDKSKQSEPYAAKNEWAPVSEEIQKKSEPKAKTEPKIAKVLYGETPTEKKKNRGWQRGVRTLVDKYNVFETLSKKTGNRDLDAKANDMRNAESRAQKLIGEGADGVDSLLSIMEAAEATGKPQEFLDYLHHWHNVDRMSLESKAKAKANQMIKDDPILQKLTKRHTIQDIMGKIDENTSEMRIDEVLNHELFEKNNDLFNSEGAKSKEAQELFNKVKEITTLLKTKNLPVFGWDVTAKHSMDAVKKYEADNPKFKEVAKKVYDYNTFLREELVSKKVVSRETADYWAEKYPHYIPIRRDGHDGLAVNVPLDTGRTGVNAPIKKATGGNSDIKDMFVTMAMRTRQTYHAGAKNSFGLELKNTLGTTISKSKTTLGKTIDSVDNHEELLKKGKDGQSPTFTVFENGERIEFEITEEMYEALKPTSDDLSVTYKIPHKLSEWQKKVLTEYNLLFTATNAIKDAQDILMNSQHPIATYKKLPKAASEIAKNGKLLQEYLSNGAYQKKHFDSQTNEFKKADKAFKKYVGMPLNAISTLNNKIEMLPRLAEYIASREAGASVEVAMLDAARVTTNFAAGGDVTKFLNRNGFTFLNASVQGAAQQVRNVREAKAKGLKGWLGLAAKVALAGLPAILLNHLMWDDDEDYEDLSDYVKDNYYVVAKYDDGKFVRIPKGRALAVIQYAMEQVRNSATGDDEADFGRFFELFMNNIAPNNPLENNIASPIIQAATNKTWYGEDLVPSRLQDLPKGEQYDETTDTFSKWLGETFNISPYKANYVLDQYSGGIGDIFLPMMTPEAERGGNTLGDNIIAPVIDKFTTDSVLKNQNVSDFYTTKDELTANANSSYATDKDILMSKYMNTVNSHLSELYAEKREIQNSNLSDKEKYEKVHSIQSEIDSISENALNTYGNVIIDGNYAKVGDVQFYLDKGEWKKLTDDQLENQEEVINGLGISESEYWSNKDEYTYAYKYPGRYAVSKAVGGYDSYTKYSSELYDIKADKDEEGKSISGSRKEKVIDYINNLDADYGEKIILFKSEYNADDTYNQDIIDYLNSRDDISYEDMETILKELGFTVDSNGNIYW